MTTKETRYCDDAVAHELEIQGWTIMWDALADTHHSAYSRHIAFREIPENDYVVYPDLQGAIR